jgi:hypothetical protein
LAQNVQIELPHENFTRTRAHGEHVTDVIERPTHDLTRISIVRPLGSVSFSFIFILLFGCYGI